MSTRTNTYSRWRQGFIVVIASLLAAPAFGALHIDGLHEAPLADFDSRSSMDTIAPTLAQMDTVAALGAHVAWTEFGTPRSLIRHGDFLATGLDADPVVAARDWLRANASLYRLSAADVDALELYDVGELAYSNARAVKFRQIYNGLASQSGGIVSVGVLDGKIAIVSGSIVGIPASTPIDAIQMTAAQALSSAAADAGFNVSAGFASETQDNAWTKYQVAGLTGTQRARPMAFVTPNGVRPVWETWLIDNTGGGTRAFMHLIDAGNGPTQGDVLLRQNKVFQAMDDAPASLHGSHKAGTKAKPAPNRAPVTENFSGEFSAPPAPFACGPLHGGYTTPGPSYQRIVIVANPTVATNDIEVRLYFDDPADIPDMGPQLLSTTDVGFGEVVNHEPGGFLPTGDYFAEICPLTNSINQNWLAPFTYEGTFTFDDAVLPSVDADPRWQHFESNPNIDLSSTDIRKLGCWQDPAAPCDFTIGNTAARGPWDYDVQTGLPSNTTLGNAAFTASAWLSPLTPAEGYRPVSATRNYSYPWTNAWYVSGCSPSEFVPQGNDIDAAVVNMFVDHNRVHDWAYYLGWTEVNSNHQYRNFGNTDQSRENDPIFGNVQAGAVDGAYPAYLGRDNANWVPLPDGAPGVTNQYLWQTLRGAIYVPCADGNYDMGIVGHEVGHGIQHRMTGGPATGLGGNQGGAMGEAWGDLTGMEIQNQFGSVPVQGESPFAIGVYVLGSPERGIRNYNMSDSPLNYSDYLYDPFGSTSPHANGEIWTATSFDVRQAFIDQHELTDPSTDAVKQRQCAEGKFAPGDCPGNRRYSLIMHDGFLLQPASPSMLDARDAQMAADVIRFAEDAGWGNHLDAMWTAFARRGMGADASATSSNDNDPTAGFALPVGHPLANATVDFTVLAKDEGDAAIPGVQIFIGHYEARANPVATTDGSGMGSATIAPGTYDFLARANGYGHMRFSLTLASGQTGPVTVKMPTNFASVTKGASATGAGTAPGNLINDTEANHWQVTDTDNIGVGEQFVEVNLGGTKSISRVQVSALPGVGGNRYENLRQFAVDACNEGITSDCLNDTDFTRVYTSDIDAFNGQPIRPLAPNHLIQSFDLPSTILASHLRMVVLHNQCTGSAEFTSDAWATGAAPPDDFQDCRDDLTGTFPQALPSRNDIVRASAFQAFGSVGDVITIVDTDGDTIADDIDNCPLTPNTDQLDQDGDSVGDVCDNCLLVSNPTQCNTNGNGTGVGEDNFGNACDADLDNNGIVNSFDLGIMRTNFGATGVNDSDLTCDGIVNSFDLTKMREAFGGNPGPSGIAP